MTSQRSDFFSIIVSQKIGRQAFDPMQKSLQLFNKKVCKLSPFIQVVVINPFAVKSLRRKISILSIQIFFFCNRLFSLFTLYFECLQNNVSLKWAWCRLQIKRSADLSTTSIKAFSSNPEHVFYFKTLSAQQRSSLFWCSSFIM